MAQEVAVALKQVDSARSVAGHQRAVAAASELILDLWEHRSSWPNGWPPTAARRRIALLAAAAERPSYAAPEPESTGSAWIDRSEELFKISIAEYRLAYALGLFEHGVEDSREVVEAAGPHFGFTDDDEDPDLATLRMEVAIHDDLLESARMAGARTNSAILDFAESQFDELAAERRKLLDELLASKLRRRRR